MCQRNAVTDKNETPTVGRMEFSPLTETERRAEIDARVSARMAFEQDRRSTYTRGFVDAFYIFALICFAAYIWFAWKDVE